MPARLHQRCASCGAMHTFTMTPDRASIPKGWQCALCLSHPAYAEHAQECLKREAEDRERAQAEYDDLYGAPVEFISFEDM